MPHHRPEEGVSVRGPDPRADEDFRSGPLRPGEQHGLESARRHADLPAARGDRVRGPAESRHAAVEMMKPFTITVVAGARPNFMKIAPIVRALNARKRDAAAAGIDLDVSIVHTGQHYDENMSEVFFRELAIPTPDHHLEVGSGSHAEKGNGFREESDIQIRAYIDGNKILVTNDAHAVHLHQSEVKIGGQRVNRLRRYYWTVFYTHYFFKKYFNLSKQLWNKLSNFSSNIYIHHNRILYFFCTSIFYFTWTYYAKGGTNKNSIRHTLP